MTMTSLKSRIVQHKLKSLPFYFTMTTPVMQRENDRAITPEDNRWRTSRLGFPVYL